MPRGNPNKLIFTKIDEDWYKGEGGRDMKRCKESGTKTENGNSLLGKLILYDNEHNMIDWDQYRFDLADRNGINLIG